MYNILQYATLPFTCPFYMKSKDDPCRVFKYAVYEFE